MTQKVLQQMKHLLIQRRMEVLKIQFTLQHLQVGQLLLYMHIQEMEQQLLKLQEHGQEQL